MGYLTSKFARFLQKSHLSFKNIEGNSFENSQGNSKRCSGSGDKSLIRFGHEIEIWDCEPSLSCACAFILTVLTDYSRRSSTSGYRCDTPLGCKKAMGGEGQMPVH